MHRERARARAPYCGRGYHGYGHAFLVGLPRSRTNGRPAEGLPHLERALRLQDSLPYTEPPAWYFPVRHVLGAVLIEAGYPDEAEVVYWTDLREHPDNGYALFGLAQSLRAQDRDDEAEMIAERFDEAWALADVELTTSRF